MASRLRDCGQWNLNRDVRVLCACIHRFMQKPLGDCFGLQVMRREGSATVRWAWKSYIRLLCRCRPRDLLGDDTNSVGIIGSDSTSKDTPVCEPKTCPPVARRWISRTQNLVSIVGLIGAHIRKAKKHGRIARLGTKSVTPLLQACTRSALSWWF